MTQLKQIKLHNFLWFLQRAVMGLTNNLLPSVYKLKIIQSLTAMHAVFVTWLPSDYVKAVADLQMVMHVDQGTLAVLRISRVQWEHCGH